MRVYGDISIDEGGRVTALGIDPRVPTAIAANVERLARAWRFRPVVVDGQAHPAKARMRLVLAARRVGGDYRVSVDHVGFPPAGDADTGDGFRVDVAEVVHTHLNPEATLLVVEWWTPEGGLRKIERE